MADQYLRLTCNDLTGMAALSAGPVVVYFKYPAPFETTDPKFQAAFRAALLLLKNAMNEP